MVTSNHVHVLVKDTGPDVIARSMQLIARRTAQEYKQRKGREERSAKTSNAASCYSVGNEKFLQWLRNREISSRVGPCSLAYFRFTRVSQRASDGPARETNC
jgi:hypothetical protein